MGICKYSPTVNTSYSKDQEWFEKNGGGFGNGKNPDSQLDDDGFDSYGYNDQNIDRAGISENQYMSSYYIDQYNEIHYTLYQEIQDEWSGIDILSDKQTIQVIQFDKDFSPYLKQLEEIEEIQKIAKKLKADIELKIRKKYPNFVHRPLIWWVFLLLKPYKFGIITSFNQQEI